MGGWRAVGDRPLHQYGILNGVDVVAGTLAVADEAQLAVERLGRAGGADLKVDPFDARGCEMMQSCGEQGSAVALTLVRRVDGDGFKLGVWRMHCECSEANGVLGKVCHPDRVGGGRCGEHVHVVG